MIEDDPSYEERAVLVALNALVLEVDDLVAKGVVRADGALSVLQRTIDGLPPNLRSTLRPKLNGLQKVAEAASASSDHVRKISP
ncbi:hypothetical protein [Teichococcus deserti]|uniref:hypothetical protein n=1 Tax=Teichococcus deserti TaxID=1817963 RepID=UPI001054A3B2|nr:hypothetical protein [Pseudoroseomonas deserti]